MPRQYAKKLHGTLIWCGIRFKIKTLRYSLYSIFKVLLAGRSCPTHTYITLQAAVIAHRRDLNSRRNPGLQKLIHRKIKQQIGAGTHVAIGEKFLETLSPRGRLL